MFLRYSIFLVILFLIYIRVSGCSALISSKPDVPSDHNNNRSGFLHTANPRDASTCTNCHGSDLRGGIYFINGRNVVTQSCYQCHGVLWNTGPGGRGGN